MHSEGERILEVQSACKRFSLTVPAKRRQLIRQFSRAIAGRADDGTQLAKDEFWALWDVSFALRRGEALGLIGLNGAGKSTLLSIIARQILPDRGSVRSRGQIAAMINLTAGFEDNLTGRENVFLKGALFGRTRSQMHSRFEEIVDFAEIDDFIDSPVGTYSSGMRMRLAFSVAVHTDPDLLLIDEVLSVGDFRFRQKCLGKLNELRAQSSFVFVSHSFQDIARFCTRLLVLNRGHLVFDGPTQEGLRVYRDTSTKPAASVPADSDALDFARSAGAPVESMGDFSYRKDVIESVSFFWCSDDEKQTASIKQGQPLVAEIRFRLLTTTEGLAIGIPFWNIDATLVTSINSDMSGASVEVDSDGWVTLRVHLDSIDFNPGTYFPVLSIVKNTEFVYRQSVACLEVTAAYGITWGVFTPKVRWTNVEPNVSSIEPLDCQSE